METAPYSLPVTKKIIVSGSLAYDYVMKYGYEFENVLIPEKLKDLSVTFPVQTQHRHFGGCGGNIAYTLRLFDIPPVLMGTIGKDYEPYFQWLKKNDIDDSLIRILNDFFTACAYIMTDQTGHQITIFHIGAMGGAPETLTLEAFSRDEIGWVIIAPDDRQRMVRFFRECRKMNVRYIFDPAQQIGEIPVDDLREGIAGAEIFILNEYEAELVSKRLNIPKSQLETLARNYVETRGAKDVYVRTVHGSHLIPTYTPRSVVDPTGCGDAFRGGMLAGLSEGAALPEACRIGALAATYALEHEGSQEHFFTREDFFRRMG